MPKKDPDLETLRKRFCPGSLYRFENDRSLNIWHQTKPMKFSVRLKNGQTLMFLRLDRSKNETSGFRVFLIRGEDIGYVLMKRYEVISCLKLLDSEINLG